MLLEWWWVVTSRRNEEVKTYNEAESVLHEASGETAMLWENPKRGILGKLVQMWVRKKDRTWEAVYPRDD